MSWKVLSVKIPLAIHDALTREANGNVPLFVRQILARHLGIEYQEAESGLASASDATRKRVAQAGAKARWEKKRGRKGA